MRTLIANGTVVTAEGSYPADVLVDGERIARIGADLGAEATVDETIDATGKYVIPGGIDVHTHMKLPFGGTFAKDDFFTGTRAAPRGGAPSAGRPRSSTSPSSRRASRCGRASTPGTPWPRATRSPTTAST